MFLYEAAEYLFDEMQSNNNYQFRNYLNLNIDNHFHNVLYSNNYYNHGPSSQQHQNLQGGPTSTNHVSLTLLPNLQSHYQKRQQQQQQNQTKNSNLQTQNTLTLPNNLNQASNLNKFNVQPQHLRINETIGNRLHNSFQDAITTIPLNSVKISMDPQSQNKSSFIDLPRSMLPSFFDSKPQQARRSTSANYRTSKAMKFMNTMRIKSVSFKRALFPNTNPSTTSQEKSPIPAAQTIQMQSHPRQSAAVEQVEGTIRMETSTEFKVQAAQQHLDHNEQKPSIIISLSSGSSSTTTSSSTALSSTPITTATESYKSSFVPATNLSVANRSSREKLG